MDLLRQLRGERPNAALAPLPSVRKFLQHHPRLRLLRREGCLLRKVGRAIQPQVLHLGGAAGLWVQDRALAFRLVRRQAAEVLPQRFRSQEPGQVELGVRIAEAVTPLRLVRLLVRRYRVPAAILPLGLVRSPLPPPALWMQPLKTMILESSQVLPTWIRHLPRESWALHPASRCNKRVRLCEIRRVLVPR